MTEENTTYQLETFEVFIISVPPLGRTVGYAAAAAAVAALLVWAAPLLGVGYGVGASPPAALAVLLVSTLVGGECIRALAAGYPRDWGYFLAFVNQLLVAGVVVVGAYVPGVGATDVLWIGAGMAALNTLEVLIITTAFREVPRLLVASLPQPAVYGGLFAATIARPPLEAGPVVVLGSAILLVIAATVVAEGMVRVNIDVKGFDVSAALTQDTPLDIGFGEQVRRPVQRLRVRNEADDFEFVVPYFHPGLMSRIGGGRMSRAITEALAGEGGGSFLKPPTSHKSDPSDPDAVEEIFEARPALPDGSADTASELVELEVESGTMTLRARQYGDLTVVFFDSERFDDVEFGAYEHALDPETTAVVDCHAHEPAAPQNLKAGTVEAERFREAVAEIEARAESLPQEAYEAGFAEAPGDVPGFALVERAGDQETLLLGFDANNISGEIQRLGTDLESTFDEVVLLTTDTHASPFKIDDQPALEDLRTAAEEARAAVAPADTSFAAGTTPVVRVYGDFYTKLIDGFNIAARFYIVSLGLVYVYLVAGVLLV